MIKNLARIDQLSVRFIKWGKTLFCKGDYQERAEVSRFFVITPEQVTVLISSCYTTDIRKRLSLRTLPLFNAAGFRF
ncbi:hypothetical protein ELLBI42_15965 [Enterobacter ludwigii]|jgi:hypothetical protein|nr:hypothetical protein [Enterobacter sp. ABFQC]QCV80942.1 hypothetical protein ELLBI42_15965 [Enterobacter ludwigii]QDE51117.1 hypothetical protein ECI140_15965 [Enterobacter ludwigii]